jgi:chorismate mutase
MTSSRGTDKFSDWFASRTEKCLVAGPCSVETETQILHTAIELAKYDVTLLRGGIWKPRTRPGTFEGVGGKGLKWLKAAGEAAGLPVATEVACAAHVELCLKSDIDVLWIGARTTTSPITVQEIASSLTGVDVPVMIKNPINPDIELWIGAIERVLNAGVKRVIAVHRGFCTHTRQKYRNQPLWSIPRELRQRLPDVPLLCDPSHICGTRKYIAQVAQDALEIGFDGLMIESHWHPETALSDAQQQLTPVQFGSLMEELVHRSEARVLNGDQELRHLWGEIEEIDQDLSVLLGRRLSVLDEVEKYRQEQNVSPQKRGQVCWMAEAIGS